MPVYQPGIPTGTVDLDVDYLNLQGNFQQANIVYSTDHYPFDNATPNQGFHNLVTTPPVVNNPPDGLPPATAANPKFYAYQQYGALGVLQYSRGPTNVVPTPLTRLHSGSTPIALANTATTNVLDFTGMTLGFCNLYAGDTSSALIRLTSFVFWSGANLGIDNLNTPIVAGLSAVSSGAILQVKNVSGGALNNIYWTLSIERIQ